MWTYINKYIYKEFNATSKSWTKKTPVFSLVFTEGERENSWYSLLASSSWQRRKPRFALVYYLYRKLLNQWYQFYLKLFHSIWCIHCVQSKALDSTSQGSGWSWLPGSTSSFPKDQLTSKFLTYFLAQDPDFPPAESPNLEEAISQCLSLCPRDYIIRLHKAKGLLQEASKSSHCETRPAGYCISVGLSTSKIYFGSKMPHITGKTFQHSASSSGSFHKKCLMQATLLRPELISFGNTYIPVVQTQLLAILGKMVFCTFSLPLGHWVLCFSFRDTQLLFCTMQGFGTGRLLYSSSRVVTPESILWTWTMFHGGEGGRCATATCKCSNEQQSFVSD